MILEGTDLPADADLKENEGLSILETIRFQSDTIPNIGPEGVTNECLLRIVEDRLGCYQKGGFDSPENAIALNAVRAARQALEYRTLLRQQRGVEGKHEQ